MPAQLILIIQVARRCFTWLLQSKQPTVVAMVLDARVNIDIEDCDAGVTALHRATTKGHLDIVCTLIERGAELQQSQQVRANESRRSYFDLVH